MLIGKHKSSTDDPACPWECRILKQRAVCAVFGRMPVQEGGLFIHEILSMQEVR